MTKPVLVCGAGPSGLSAALFLATRGLPVMIFDKNGARTDKSKAIGVQPGTLELLAKCFGEDLSREMVDAGIAAKEFYFHTDNDKVFPVRFNSVPSPFNSLLMLRQSETERILEERLNAAGVRVRRGCELINFFQKENGVDVTLRSAGETSVADGAYLIGCDGAHSATRKILNFDFAGGVYDGEFVLADLRVDWPWSHGSIRTFVAKPGAAAFFPLKGDKEYRLILIPRQGTPEIEKPELNIEVLRREAAPFLPSGIELSDPVWLSRFHVHHRLTPKMGEGRVFLCGDAAHIHSPVGAQGMNTGIHDAVDLCWRIERVLKGEVGDQIFEGFLRDRHRNAEQVVRFTDLAFRTIFAKESFFTRFARHQILPRVISRSAVQKPLVRYISEIDVPRRIAANVRPRI